MYQEGFPVPSHIADIFSLIFLPTATEQSCPIRRHGILWMSLFRNPLSNCAS
jgi:hypothetical protein